MLKRQLKPPLVPGPAGENLVANFDPHFTEQPHTIYAPEEIASCFERDFAGFDYVRQLSAGAAASTGRPAAKMSASSASTVSSRSSFKDGIDDFEASASPANQDQQCEDDKPELELEAELEVDSVRIKI